MRSFVRDFYSQAGSHQLVDILAASKQVPIDRLNTFIKSMNDLDRVALVGESYVQEMYAKLPGLKGKFELHFIGRIQSNKVGKLVAVCDVIESVGRQKILELIAQEVTEHKKEFQRIFLQVNVSCDPHKDGFTEDQLAGAVKFCELNKSVKLEGLMTITEHYDDPEKVRADYRQLQSLANRYAIAKVSMGMSGDYPIAIEEGATIIRLGTILFGARRDVS